MLFYHTKAATETLMKYLFDGGYLPGKFVSVQGIGISWKIVCVRGSDRASWKMSICSMNLLKKTCLFDKPFWKIRVCSTSRWTLLLENYKKVAPGKKEQIFWKTVSVAASDHNINVYET